MAKEPVKVARRQSQDPTDPQLAANSLAVLADTVRSLVQSGDDLATAGDRNAAARAFVQAGVTLRVVAGAREEVLHAYHKALAIYEQLLRDDPGNPRWLANISVTNKRIGDVLVEAGDREAARAAYRKSFVIDERLAADDPDNAEWQNGLAISYSKLGDMLIDAGEREAALVAYRKSFAIAEVRRR